MRKVEAFFNRAYGSVDRYWWQAPQRYSTNPDDHWESLMTQLLLRYAVRRGPGRALDLGCGEGADAIRLAKLGWEVDAVDVSSVAAEKTSRFAAEAGVSVAVHNVPAETFESDQPYDLIVSNGLLHYVADKGPVIRRLQDMTCGGGCNALSLWSTFTPVPECHKVVPTYPDDEFGVTTAEYQNWTKLLSYFERGKLETGHHEFPEHSHSYIKLIALKP